MDQSVEHWCGLYYISWFLPNYLLMSVYPHGRTLTVLFFVFCVAEVGQAALVWVRNSVRFRSVSQTVRVGEDGSLAEA